MKRHAENALKVARFLEGHAKVTLVRYPGLKSHPQHQVAASQMTDFAGMLNFTLDTDLMTNFSFLKELKLITHAVSLGHDQSLIIYIPTLFFFEDMVKFDEAQKEKYTRIMGDGVFRFSVGMEDAEDIIGDLDQALGKI